MYVPQQAVALRLSKRKRRSKSGKREGVSEPLLTCEPVPCTAPVPQNMEPLCPRAWLMFLPWVGVAFVQLEESEFTCAAAVKARKAMEVEMEDLHLQIDDIAKAKTAVRGGVSRAGPGAEGELNHDCLHPTVALPCQGFLQGSTLPSHASPLLSLNSSRVLRGGRAGRRVSQPGCTSPCLTTCLWELGRRPWNHK